MTSELIPPLDSAACKRCSFRVTKGVRKCSSELSLCAPSILAVACYCWQYLLQILLSRRSAERTQCLGILPGDHAPGKITALRVATALRQRRPVILIAQDAHQGRPQPLSPQ